MGWVGRGGVPDRLYRKNWRVARVKVSGEWRELRLVVRGVGEG